MAGGVTHGCSARHRQAGRRVGRNEGDRRLSLGTGHELGVDGRGLDGEVAHGSGLDQRHHANVGTRIGYHRVARLGRIGRPCEGAAGGRSGEVKAQRVADRHRHHGRFVILVVVVGEAALDHGDGCGAHVLLLLRGQTFVLDQDEGLADIGHGVARALEQLHHALTGDVVLEQIARPFGALVEIGFDAGLRLFAGVEGLLGEEQRNADALVLRRLGHDDVGPEVGVSVVGGHLHEGLAQIDAAPGAIQFGDVGEDGIGDAVCNRAAGGRATAFGHIGHHGGLEQFDVAGLDGHTFLLI